MGMSRVNVDTYRVEKRNIQYHLILSDENDKWGQYCSFRELKNFILMISTIGVGKENFHVVPHFKDKKQAEAICKTVQNWVASRVKISEKTVSELKSVLSKCRRSVVS